MSVAAATVATNLPEPLDQIGFWCAVLESGVALPVLQVDLAQARHHQFQLLLVKQCQHTCWDDLMEAVL